MTKPIFKDLTLARKKYIHAAYLIVDSPMGKQKPLVSFDYQKCSQCTTLICLGVCPQGILDVGKENKPTVSNASECTTCGICVSRCPRKAVVLNTNRGRRTIGEHT